MCGIFPDRWRWWEMTWTSTRMWTSCSLPAHAYRQHVTRRPHLFTRYYWEAGTGVPPSPNTIWNWSSSSLGKQVKIPKWPWYCSNHHNCRVLRHSHGMTRMHSSGCVPPALYRTGGLPDRDSSGQRPPWTEIPPDRDPARQTPPDRGPPLDRDPLDRPPSPRTETETLPSPANRQTRMKILHFPNFVCGR